MSKITLNIVEPGGSTPVDPSVPNTGLFVHGIGTPEAIIIASGGVNIGRRRHNNHRLSSWKIQENG